MAYNGIQWHTKWHTRWHTNIEYYTQISLPAFSGIQWHTWHTKWHVPDFSYFCAMPDFSDFSEKNNSIHY